MARHSQAHPVAGAVDVLAFKFRGGHPQKSGGPQQVGLGQVHEALLAATFRTSGLAFETKGLGHVLWGQPMYYYGLQVKDLLWYILST
jgi:hypothetical protein